MTPTQTTRVVVALLAVIGMGVAFAAPAIAQPCDGDFDQQNDTVSASCAESTDAGAGAGSFTVDGSGDGASWDGDASGQNDDFGGAFLWTSGNGSADGGDGEAGFWGNGFGQSGGEELSCTVDESTRDCS